MDSPIRPNMTNMAIIVCAAAFLVSGILLLSIHSAAAGAFGGYVAGWALIHIGVLLIAALVAAINFSLIREGRGQLATMAEQAVMHESNQRAQGFLVRRLQADVTEVLQRLDQASSDHQMLLTKLAVVNQIKELGADEALSMADELGVWRDRNGKDSGIG